VAILLVIPLAACQTTGSAVTEATFCGAAKAIYWSKNDTAPTVAQVREHNAVGKSLCAWGKK
jgi:hypothetical protein